MTTPNCLSLCTPESVHCGIGDVTHTYIPITLIFKTRGAALHMLSAEKRINRPSDNNRHPQDTHSKDEAASFVSFRFAARSALTYGRQKEDPRLLPMVQRGNVEKCRDMPDR